jgi:outer membrane lipoprotein-sorting protein
MKTTPRAALLLLVAACGGAQVQRRYPAPAAKELLDHVAAVRERAATLNARTKTDVRLGDERVNVTVEMLAAWGGKLRFQAMDPNSAMAADLASDGKRYCFVDVHHNCSECGPATPERVARLVRIPLEPDQVVAVLMGSAPLLPDAQAKESWDPDGGHEILTLAAGDTTERLVLDGRDKRWDVLEAEARRGDKLLWRIRHKDFHDVKTAGGATARVPGASLFEQGGDTVRILWREQKLGEPLDESKFQLTPQAGLRACPQ